MKLPRLPLGMAHPQVRLRTPDYRRILSGVNTALQIEGIGQIHIAVSDIERAVAFYRDTLGLKLLFQVPGQNMAFFDCGGTRLYLSEDSSEQVKSSPLIYYSVADLDAACTGLNARGVTLDRPPHCVHRTQTGELWLAGFSDSEGNYVQLMSEKPLHEE